MRLSHVQALLLAPLSVQAIRIVLSNDDGWAAKTVRVFYDTLTAAGQNVVLSAPAENQSGRSSLDAPPKQVDGDGCQYQSCPPNSPPTGADPTNPRINYVNSFPVTAMKYGIQELTGVIGGVPELALSGINAGTNGGIVALISGTVGAATEAAKQGIPAIAFSGTSGEQVGFNTPTLPYQQIYSDLSLNITETLVAAGKPYLPKDIWINVNFPAVGAEGEACSRTSDFKFVLTRVYPWLGGDVETCGGTWLPDETSVFNSDGCHVSVSVSNAWTKADVDAATQKVVLDKLAPILSCMPPNGTQTVTKPSAARTQSTSAANSSGPVVSGTGTSSSAAAASTSDEPSAGLRKTVPALLMISCYAMAIIIG